MAGEDPSDMSERTESVTPHRSGIVRLL